MDIRDLKLYIYESCDCGIIDDNTCKNMITACESVSTTIGSGMISIIQSSVNSVKELLLDPSDYKIKKDIVVNKTKETEIYACSNLLKDCIGNRNIDSLSNHIVLKLVRDFKDADYSTWRDNVHKKIDSKIISKILKELDHRNKTYSNIMKNYKNEIDTISLTYEDYPNKYTATCNEDIHFYNDYIKECIDNIGFCKEILEKYDEYNLPLYTGILRTYISTVVKLNMRTAQHCHNILKKTLEHNKRIYESM